MTFSSIPSPATLARIFLAASLGASVGAYGASGASIEECRAMVLVAHGLNLKPSRMVPLAEAICSPESGLHCRFVQLQGHEEEGPSRMREVTLEAWKKDFSDQLNDLRASARGRPIYFLGFSLGALFGPWAQLEFEGRPFEKMALISPPLETHAYSRLVRLIPGPSHWTLPSWNHADYRANDRTSLGAYRALFALQDEIREGESARLDVDTLLFVNPRDELVSEGRLRRRIERRRWTHWRVESIAPVEPTLTPVYQHLMIDEASLGKDPWERLTRTLREYFGLDPNSEYLTPQ